MDRLTEICRRYRVCRLALFGSALRDDFGPQSDIDLLVEFLPGATPGLACFTLQNELTQVFDRKVDLNTAGFLGSQIRDTVLAEALPIYAAS